MTPNRRGCLHFFDLCVPKTPSVSRDGSGNCNQARVLETIHFGGSLNLLSRLLSAARVTRPSSCHAAEQRDEIATLHSITSSARASRAAGTSTPRIRAV